MKTKLAILLALAFITLSLPAIEPDPAFAPRKESAGRVYFDNFLSLRTTDFSHDEAFGYGLGVGYNFTKVFAADVRVSHEGLNIEGQAVRAVGGRVLARLPWEFLSPYGFLGAEFDLGPDQWRLQPGAGVEIGVSKKLKGLSIFGEAGLDADLKGKNGFLFSSGLRWRF